MYAWRLGPDCPEELRPKTDAEFKMLLRETDFAFRQAIAFCPYSPEAVFHYVNMLVTLHRLDDAIMLVATWRKLDPYNAQVNEVLQHLWDMRQSNRSSTNAAEQGLAQLEKAVAANPADFQQALNLASEYLRAQNTNQALQVLDGILNHPAADTRAFRTLVEAYSSFGDAGGVQRVGEKLRARFIANPSDIEAGIGLADVFARMQQRSAALQVMDQILSSPGLNSNVVLEVAQQCAALGDYQRVEMALQKVTQLSPGMPEGWYDLASMESLMGKTNEAIAALRQALALSAKRLAADPKAHNLADAARKEPRLEAIRKMPEFQQLMKP
jgi:thioredoxin-like negative regulator of GroEL